MSSHKHNPSAGTQNQGNTLGDQPCVRQSKLYRMHESGNGVKGVLGMSNLCWDTEHAEGAYRGQKVFDHNAVNPYQSSAQDYGSAQTGYGGGYQSKGYGGSQGYGESQKYATSAQEYGVSSQPSYGGGRELRNYVNPSVGGSQSRGSELRNYVNNNNSYQKPGNSTITARAAPFATGDSYAEHENMGHNQYNKPPRRVPEQDYDSGASSYMMSKMGNSRQPEYYEDQGGPMATTHRRSTFNSEKGVVPQMMSNGQRSTRPW